MLWRPEAPDCRERKPPGNLNLRPPVLRANSFSAPPQGPLGKNTVYCLHFSTCVCVCVCRPCAGAILTFSASFQVRRMIPEGNPTQMVVVLLNRCLTTIEPRSYLISPCNRIRGPRQGGGYFHFPSQRAQQSKICSFPRLTLLVSSAGVDARLKNKNRPRQNLRIPRFLLCGLGAIRRGGGNCHCPRGEI